MTSLWRQKHAWCGWLVFDKLSLWNISEYDFKRVITQGFIVHGLTWFKKVFDTVSALSDTVLSSDVPFEEGWEQLQILPWCTVLLIHSFPSVLMLSELVAKLCNNTHSQTHSSHLAAIVQNGNGHVRLSLWELFVSACVFLGVHTIDPVCVKMPVAAALEQIRNLHLERQTSMHCLILLHS